MRNDDSRTHPYGVSLGRSAQTFAAAVRPNPLQWSKVVVLPFEQDVEEFLDSSTSSCTMLDDEKIADGSEHNDFYGLLTSVQDFLGAKPKNEKMHLEFTITVQRSKFAYFNVDESERGWRGKDVSHHYLPKSTYVVDEGQSIEDIQRIIDMPFEKRLDDNGDIAIELRHEEPETVATLTLTSKMDVEQQVAEVMKLVCDLQERFDLDDSVVEKIEKGLMEYAGETTEE